MTDNNFKVTLKSGEGFAAPWITIAGDSEAEVAFHLKAAIGGDPVATDLFGLVAEAAAALKGQYTANDVLVAPVVQAAPAPAFQPTTAGPGRWEGAPADTAPAWVGPVPRPLVAGPPAAQCVHGAMVARSGNKNGRDWSGYFCPTPKGTVGQCAPVFGA